MKLPQSKTRYFWITSLFFALFGILAPIAHAQPPFPLPPKDKLVTIRSMDLFLEKGTVRFELFPQEAPWHVANMKYLADKGFYKGLSFHIVYPGIIIQGGAPKLTDPNSGPGYSIDPEFNDSRRHKHGSLGMARFPNEANADRSSHGSQFHILLSESPKMDREYTIFGECSFNCELLDEIKKGEMIRDVKVYVRGG